MKNRALVTWLSPLAVALLAFGSQIAFAQDASTLARDEVRADALQAQKSGALERQRVTSYSANANWGPGAPSNTSHRATASRPARSGADIDTETGPARDIQSKKSTGTQKRDPA